MLHRIGPLREALVSLEEQREVAEQQLASASKEVRTLAARIRAFKQERAKLLSDSRALESEMQITKAKCCQSMQLLTSVSQERARWEVETPDFTAQSATVVGDCLLSAGFVAYIGYFDEHFRTKLLLPAQLDALEKPPLDFKGQLSIIEHLLRPDDRLRWTANRLRAVQPWGSASPPPPISL